MTMFSVFPLTKASQSWISRKSIWRYPFWKTSHFISLAQWLCVCLIYLTVRLFYSLWSVVYLIQIISLFSVTYIFNHLGNTSSSSRISTWQEKLASHKSRKAGLSESQIKWWIFALLPEVFCAMTDSFQILKMKEQAQENSRSQFGILA